MRARLGRRRLLGGIAAFAASGPATALARATTPAPAKAAPARNGTLLGEDFGIVPGDVADQSKAVQAALDAAHDRGRPLLLPAGHIFVQNLEIPGGVRVEGVPGGTVLIAWQDNPIGKALIANDLWLEGIGFSGAPGGAASDHGLLVVESSVGVNISNGRFLIAGTSGLLLQDAAATIADCSFDQLDVAIFSHNSRGLTIRGNRISNCANGGVLIWRDAPGADGSIVTGNRISSVLARAGGSGQNGNAVNLFRADDVVVSDNVVSDCDFSAVRANSTRNCAIRGNTCTNIREVALYSEFAFSGSVISGNIVDGAAGGISITNLDQGGQLAVCAGNIVRNIFPSSPTNPDARPVGIYVEAETTVTGNTVQNVPGPGIAAGYGPYLRNVLIADNVISGADTAIAVSVVEKAGPVRIAGNMISGTRTAPIVGMAWEKVVSADLLADAAKFPAVTMADNIVSP